MTLENSSLPDKDSNSEAKQAPIPENLEPENSATETIPPAKPSSSGALVTLERPSAPQGFRVRLAGDVPPQDNLADTAVLAYEYERRRDEWWRWRRLGLLGLPSLTVVFLLVTLVGLIWGWAGVTFWIFVLLLIASLLFSLYSWWTLPRVLSFGRAYRRFVSVPLAKGGIVWCDASIPAPNFTTLRDSFFNLYKDSRSIGERARPNNNAEDTIRKKQTLNDLATILKPATGSQTEKVPTPFLPREKTGVLDRMELEPVEWGQAGELAGKSLPLGMQHLNNPLELQRLVSDVEQYANMKADNVTTTAIVQVTEATNAPLHRQLAVRISESFGVVGTEVDRWREQSNREKLFYTQLTDRYKNAEEQVRLGYERTVLSLEEEVAPTIAQIQADADFYKRQILTFYDQQRQVIESRRDSVLGRLDRDRQEMERVLDERSDEQSRMMAEFKLLNDQRLKLETSTDSRFANLKSQLNEMVHKTMALPATPYFRSDYQEEGSARSAQECMDQLAELRAEARLTTNAVNNAMNRFARLRFEPLDELAQLEEQINGSSKWQATSYLANLVNFKQSGQLLALAGEISEAAGVYLDAVADFERLNRRWCALESSLNTLGLTSYAGRLQEAQEYLLGLSQVTSSLHSSLVATPHNPEMARPAVFQTLYDNASGLQRELEELGALAGSITRTEDRLNELNAEITTLKQNIQQNLNESEQVRTDASIKLYEISQKGKQIQEKLAEMVQTRTQRIRTHIDELNQEKVDVAKILRSFAGDLEAIRVETDRILQRHTDVADQVMTKARQLHQGLESTLASIVQDFDASILSGRHVEAASELFIPVWYFQFSDRPVWKERVMGFASCYTTLERTSTASSVGDPQSIWRFLGSPQPATYYRLKEEVNLTNLIGAHHLDYPAGAVEVPLELLDKLAAEKLLNRWLVKVIRLAGKAKLRKMT